MNVQKWNWNRNWKQQKRTTEWTNCKLFIRKMMNGVDDFDDVDDVVDVDGRAST